MSANLQCDFCAHNCRLAEGQTGHCGVRRNIGGRITTLGRDQAVALAVDPMGKKPFHHAFPGAQVLSVAMFGCNFNCQFCQNAAISQPDFAGKRSGIPLTPHDFAARRRQQNLTNVAFTYSEPTVWQDWLIEAATEIKADGGNCFMISNGYFTAAARERFAGLIDGYNIDLKGSDDFYRRYCGGRLEPVLINLRALCPRPDIIVEVCTLVIEGIHSVDDILKLGDELSAAGGKVWHLSRFFPAYKMLDRAPTSEDFLQELLEKIQSRIDIPYIYPGNSSLNQDTACPGCGRVLVERRPGTLHPHLLFDPASIQTSGTPRCPDCQRELYLMV